MINIRKYILIFVLLTTINGKAIITKTDGEIIEGILPEEILQFAKDMTPSDIKILTELSSMKYQFGSQNELIEAIKEKSPELAIKIEHLMQGIMEKYNTLSDESKNFIKELGEKLKNFNTLSTKVNKIEQLKVFATNFLPAYSKLSNNAKEELKQIFPMFDFLSITLPKIVNIDSSYD
ncbi:Nematode fatty acid retinoid binding family-containing protein [Strongyloides ratti]|uniref:Fatty-acid and retinol-binding protein 1 n=1 Tax=Strongyloides ratti TaxID=34506 RepID=A0A090LKP3_STRRB|nr:Nematode fatty acid retinoid binding family-containing protein [Strongyloides ratti]CEF70273.1 Nematode fatty acid retinoid binding family-containing protein [Strongyloides ratti]